MDRPVRSDFRAGHRQDQQLRANERDSHLRRPFQFRAAAMVHPRQAVAERDDEQAACGALVQRQALSSQRRGREQHTEPADRHHEAHRAAKPKPHAPLAQAEPDHGAAFRGPCRGQRRAVELQTRRRGQQRERQGANMDCHAPIPSPQHAREQRLPRGEAGDHRRREVAAHGVHEQKRGEGSEQSVSVQQRDVRVGPLPVVCGHGDQLRDQVQHVHSRHGRQSRRQP